MFFPLQPSPETIRRFISSQRELPFSYPEVGATAADLPPGYIVDRNRTKMGTGKEPYERAIAALRNWKQFDLGWVKLVSDENTPRGGCGGVYPHAPLRILVLECLSSRIPDRSGKDL